MSATGFLYPFLDDDRSDATDERGIAARRAALHGDLVRSATAKWVASTTATATALAINHALLRTAANILRSAGRVLVAGNGGSACDADRLVRLLPSTADRRSVSLTADPAVLTALANDIGVERMFARLVDAHGRAGDVLVVFSTSGQSLNLLAALEMGHRRGLRTIAFAGYGGGRFVDNGDVDVAIAVNDASVHRIQEVQAVLADTLVVMVHQLDGVR